MIPNSSKIDRGCATHDESAQGMHRLDEGCCGKHHPECATPGDTTTVTGGIHEDFQLNRVLLRMRAQPAKGKLVVVCTKIEKEWRIARLSGIRGVPPEFVTDKSTTMTGSAARHLRHAARRVRRDRRISGALQGRLETPRRFLDRDLTLVDCAQCRHF